MPSHPLYISVPEAAEALGAHPNSIRAWIKSGRLPAKRFGRHWKIPREAVQPDIPTRPSLEVVRQALQGDAPAIVREAETGDLALPHQQGGISWIRADQSLVDAVAGLGLAMAHCAEQLRQGATDEVRQPALRLLKALHENLGVLLAKLSDAGS